MPLGNPNFYFDGVNLTKIHVKRFYCDRQDCNRNRISIFGRHTFYGILTRHTPDTLLPRKTPTSLRWDFMVIGFICKQLLVVTNSHFDKTNLGGTLLNDIS